MLDTDVGDKVWLTEDVSVHLCRGSHFIYGPHVETLPQTITKMDDVGVQVRQSTFMIRSVMLTPCLDVAPSHRPFHFVFPPPAEPRHLGVGEQDPLPANSGGRWWPQNLLDPRAERRWAHTGEHALMTHRVIESVLIGYCLGKREKFIRLMDSHFRLRSYLSSTKSRQKIISKTLS